MTVQNQKSFGFTIIELLIIIALISVLAITAFIGAQLQIYKGNDTIRKGDLDKLKIAFENYSTDHGSYPPQGTFDNHCQGSQLQPYLDAIPCDPVTKAPYRLILYPETGAAQKFAIVAILDNKNDPESQSGQYIVYSSNTTNLEVENLFKLGQFYSLCVNGYYGCVNGACVLVNSSARPNCSPVFCIADCQGSCSRDGFELTPQPCLP